MEINLQDALERAAAWAREVGGMQVRCFRGNDLGIETKSNAYDVVTRVDRQSESMLLERIAAVATDSNDRPVRDVVIRRMTFGRK